MFRTRLIRASASEFSVVAVLALAGPAVAGKKVPLRGTGEGQVIYQVDPTPEAPEGIQVYIATGRANVMGEARVFGVTFLTAEGQASGYAFFITSDGSTIVNEYEGMITPIPDSTTVRFEIETRWHSGTRRLSGLTGCSDAEAILNVTTGVFDVVHAGYWFRQ
jgi:hypothetical protein